MVNEHLSNFSILLAAAHGVCIAWCRAVQPGGAVVGGRLTPSDVPSASGGVDVACERISALFCY